MFGLDFISNTSSTGGEREVHTPLQYVRSVVNKRFQDGGNSNTFTRLQRKKLLLFSTGSAKLSGLSIYVHANRLHAHDCCCPVGWLQQCG